MRKAWTDDRLDDLVKHMDDGFAQVDARFGRIETRLERIEGRFDKLQNVLIGGFLALVVTLFVTNLG